MISKAASKPKTSQPPSLSTAMSALPGYSSEQKPSSASIDIGTEDQNKTDLLKQILINPKQPQEPKPTGPVKADAKVKPPIAPAKKKNVGIDFSKRPKRKDK